MASAHRWILPLVSALLLRQRSGLHSGLPFRVSPAAASERLFLCARIPSVYMCKSAPQLDSAQDCDGITEERFTRAFPNVSLMSTKSSAALDDSRAADLFVQTLTLYKDIFGIARVNCSFVIPAQPPWAESSWGADLHSWTLEVRAQRKSLSAAAVAQVKALGLPWSSNDNTFELYLHALSLYRRKYGHLALPQSFVVPNDSSWPRFTWGMRLGALTHRVRKGDFVKERPDWRESLNKLGFIWNVREHKFSVFMRAMHMYFVAHRTLDMPVKYQVPISSAWPADVRGMRLGRTFHMYCHDRVFVALTPDSYSSIRSTLSDEFVSVLKSTRHDAKDRSVGAPPSVLPLPAGSAQGLGLDVLGSRARMLDLLQACTAYRNLHGDLAVPPSYLMDPSLAAWPSSLAGRDLGALLAECVRGVRLLQHGASAGTAVEASVDQLLRIGVVRAQDVRFLQFLRCMRVYKSRHKHLIVPQRFAIPAHDSLPWPEDWRGVRLGAMVAKVRLGQQFSSPEQRTALNKLGFVWKAKRAELARFVLALQTHYELFGDYNVPRYFVVPADSEWPECTWGMSLGVKVRNVRHYNVYSEPEYARELAGLIPLR